MPFPRPQQPNPFAGATSDDAEYSPPPAMPTRRPPPKKSAKKAGKKKGKLPANFIRRVGKK